MCVRACVRGRHLESSRKVLLVFVGLLKLVLCEVDVGHLWFDLGTGAKTFDGLFPWTAGAVH